MATRRSPEVPRRPLDRTFDSLARNGVTTDLGLEGGGREEGTNERGNRRRFGRVDIRLCRANQRDDRPGSLGKARKEITNELLNRHDERPESWGVGKGGRGGREEGTNERANGRRHVGSLEKTIGSLGRRDRVMSSRRSARENNRSRAYRSCRVVTPVRSREHSILSSVHGAVGKVSWKAT